MATLNVYEVVPADTSVERLVDLATRIFAVRDPFVITETEDSRCLRCGDYFVELYKASGYVWAADESQLWNTELRPQLLVERDAQDRALAWALERGLLPDMEPFQRGEPTVTRTQTALHVDGREREEWPLDIQVTYPISINGIPVTGGGSKITIIMGHNGNVIGFCGGWRPVRNGSDYPVVDPEDADDEFARLSGKLAVRVTKRTIAYYAAPPFAVQQHVYPIYVYDAVGELTDRTIPLRQVSIAATEFGAPLAAPVLPEAKGSDGERSPTGVAARKAASPRAADGEVNEAKPAVEANGLKVGTWWLSSTLPHARANARGFTAVLASAGAEVSFEHDDALALESDFNSNAAARVDAVDFALFVGHADMSGWVLTATVANPGDKELYYTDVGEADPPPGVLWGRRLKWMIIAACGPLQDQKLANGGGSATQRWHGAFDGLHLLMGYGAISFDNPYEGGRVATHARRGAKLIDAWFRTAFETQPSTNRANAPNGPKVHAGAMWPLQAGINPSNDRFGSISAKPSAPEAYQVKWIQC